MENNCLSPRLLFGLLLGMARHCADMIVKGESFISLSGEVKFREQLDCVFRDTSTIH